MRNDFANIHDTDIVCLYPKSDNPFHYEPVYAIYHNGNYYCEDRSSGDEPSYTEVNIHLYVDGYDFFVGEMPKSVQGLLDDFEPLPQEVF
jgi:hypothetical protein